MTFCILRWSKLTIKKMNILSRLASKQIEKYLFKGKVLIIYGPRQVGKTTLVKRLMEQYNGRYLLCEEPDIAAALAGKTSTELWHLLGENHLIILDEAQKVENIGTVLKLLVDTRPEIQIVATGSSSFELANKINEPLTGRNFEIHMYPLTVSEIVNNSSLLEAKRLLEPLLIYGSYPEIFLNTDLKVDLLKKITNDYLYKDILSFGDIRKPSLLRDILRALALQVGSQVSYSELASLVGASRATVQSYIDILEKAFILFKLYPLSSRKRNEIRHMHKIYFYDNGLLNTLLQNYNALALRGDTGALFENFFISEKMKEKAYTGTLGDVYFWRSKTGQEVDFIESFEGGTRIVAYECKWAKSKAKLPSQFQATYKVSEFKVITKDNVMEELSRA